MYDMYVTNICCLPQKGKRSTVQQGESFIEGNTDGESLCFHSLTLQVFIECAGKTLRSSVIQKYKSNPNFTVLVDVIELVRPTHLM